MSWQALLVLGLLFGVAYGFLFQKGDLCFVAAFRDLYAFRDTRVLRAIVPAVLIALLGWAVLLQTSLAPASRLWVPPAGLASLLGGVLFGIGMYVAGSCASGTLYRAGMGYVHFWIVFAAMGAGYLTFAALYEPYLAPVLQRLTPLPPATLYAYSPLPVLPTALLVVALAVGLIVRVTGWSGLVRHVRETLTFFRRPVGELLRARAWDTRAVGLCLGVLVVLQFALWSAVGITTAETRIAALVAAAVAGEGWVRDNAYLGPLFSRYPGLTLGPGELLVFGVVIGAAVASRLSGAWRLRMPRWNRLPNAVLGGFLMGFASRVAPGCNVGNILGGLPSLSLHSILATVGIATGVVLAQAFVQWRTSRALATRVMPAPRPAAPAS